MSCGHNAPNTGLKQANSDAQLEAITKEPRKNLPLWMTEPVRCLQRWAMGIKLHLRMTSMTRWRRKVRLLWRAPKRFRSSSQTLSEG